MPLFLDSHILPEGVTAEMVAEAHAKDVAIEATYGVRYLKYWYDATRGRAFCLVLAPSKEAADVGKRPTSPSPNRCLPGRA